MSHEKHSQDDLTSDFSFRPSYKSSHQNQGELLWLVGALEGFYADKLIDDVLRSVKGGKEANVYQCSAHPSTGVAFLAAKVYRPQKHRSLKNDAIYREGRGVIGEDGKTITARDKRMGRAVQKMTHFGQQLRIGSWIGHEYETLQLLGDAGVDVPLLYALGDGAILMEYLGDEDGPAHLRGRNRAANGDAVNEAAQPRGICRTSRSSSCEREGERSLVVTSTNATSHRA